MALTRKLLKGMGLTDEQVDTIIEAHSDTVDGFSALASRFLGQDVTGQVERVDIDKY